jgi:hypothetical protein
MFVAHSFSHKLITGKQKTTQKKDRLEVENNSAIPTVVMRSLEM